jgi:flavin-dependent dehydrogenase
MWRLLGRADRAFAEIRERMIRLAARPGYLRPTAGAACLWSGRGTTWHQAGGLVSCGDAAGLIDPYSGEGTSAALISGSRAGASIAAFVMGDASALPKYSRWVTAFFSAQYGWAGARWAF